MKNTQKLMILTLLIVAMMTACSSKKTTDNQPAATNQPKATDSQTEVTQEPSEATQAPTEAVSASATIRIASLKGPTTMGMVKLMSDSNAGTTKNQYKVTMHGTPDEIVTQIVKGDIDVACVPCNLASVLYNKTKGGIRVAAINTLGVLYVVENGTTVQSVEDLKGKTIYSTGKGTSPEYVLNYVLSMNGIDPAKDVTIEYKSEATEVAALLANDDSAIAMLPQPFVTIVSAKNKNLRVALDMSAEWNKIQGEGEGGSDCVTGVVVVRNEFLDQNKEVFNEFLNDYLASTQYVNSDVAGAAVLIGEYDIVPEAIAKAAIPKCNITFVEGEDMKTKISGYLKVLFDQNPEAVGGKLPDDAFYYER